jgi:hypothetical protein
MALGGGTDVRLVESVPAAARALRKAFEHSRGIHILGVRADLLAIPASRLGGVLKLSIVPVDYAFSSALTLLPEFLRHS